MRILIADDHNRFRLFLRRVLESERDVTVVGEAADGNEAIARTEKLHPDLVLMDMNLPATDGLEATRQIKASSPKTRVFMLSSIDGPAYRDAATRCGADGFLPKLSPLPMILSLIRKSGTTRVA